MRLLSVLLALTMVTDSWAFLGVGFSTNAFLGTKLTVPKSTSNNSNNKITTSSDAFLTSGCDDFNLPPSLNTIQRSFDKLASGSDIRGHFLDHERLSNINSVALKISNFAHAAPLTPLAAHCLGFAYATMLDEEQKGSSKDPVIIAVGKDPRSHGNRLVDAFGRGAESVDNVKVVFTGIATTPAMFDFCR
jgi:hypothetical protein